MADSSGYAPQSEPSTQSIVRDNWLRIRQQVMDACQQAARDPLQVTIVGVAKYVDASLTAQLVSAGCQHIGENRPQLLWEKHEWFSNQALQQPHWHLIGHLQRNKVRRTLPLVEVVEAVDSLRLAEELDREAQRLNRQVAILTDVNLTKDDSKTGFGSQELQAAAEQIACLPNLRWCGLMAMSSQGADSKTIRQEFAQVRLLRDRLQAELGSAVSLTELSMGMSGDFLEAIAEGSTSLRIGSHLWSGLMP